MVIGVGIVLIVLGLILVTGAVDLPTSWENHLAGDTLGWILFGVGVLAIILGLIVNHQRSRVTSTHVEERRGYGDGPRREVYRDTEGREVYRDPGDGRV